MIKFIQGSSSESSSQESSDSEHEDGSKRRRQSFDPTVTENHAVS